ncbi:DUF1830 domain-containing protein [Microcoleus sp. FACHB-SPT15]|uniref:DUF1830 domain-containing protein n=1 Tax=Microcoleus sp. FACHB-SPT15 TaxID=2692830 RepID=UPI00178370D8|nr:DUF1830 domain-containing protein [Microcoleus sp. FACHB-SPT15]MBD1808677.1 DUF1830 domain-containing protein [Microcoleus sp. FACHB-SPT15]
MTLSANLRPITTSSQLLYSYINTTSSLQVIQIVNIPNWHFERVIFPGQRLLFYAPPNTDLEVQTSYFGQAILVKKIPGVQLEVKQ